jgi:3-oxoacyl-[acyl-carrier protein] reductase
MSRFGGKVVVVTGASRGLGRALACAFGREEAHVWIGYHRRQEDAEETRATIADAGGRATLLPLDVRSTDSVDKAFAEVLAQAGPVDVLVNNAGLARDNFLALMEDDAFGEVLDVNLTGVFRCCRAVSKSMIHRRAGVIVNVGSVVGLRASPGQVNYSASKGGLEALTRTLAAELGPRGIRVNAVSPGFLTTGMALRMDHRILKKRQEHIPLGRSGEATEVAPAILFLASSEASYITGHTLVVDGGLSV